MYWVRVDNRLVHGQVIEAWLPFTAARTLIVANNTLADDLLQQQIVSLAIPNRVQVHFLHITDINAQLKKINDTDILILLANCQDAVQAFDAGVPMHTLNIGNLHYSENKLQIYPHVAVNKDDVACLKYLAGRDVCLDFRCIPSDSVQEWHGDF